MANSAENLGEEESIDNEQKASKNKGAESKDLTDEEREALDNNETTIYKLAADRRRLKDEANKELNNMVQTGRTGKNIIDLKEYSQFQKELNETDSPEKTKEILERIKDLPRQKELERNSQADKARRLDPEDPKLLELQEKFDSICEENEDLIGAKEVEGFEAWAAQERRKNPTVANMEDMIKRLEGKESSDRGGLAPRREEFKKLTELFKKFDAGSPLDNEFIAEQGLSERTQFRKNAETMMKHLEQQRDTGFYSAECLKTSMTEILTAEDPRAQIEMIDQSKRIARKESEGYIYLNDSIQIEGKSIRKMSESSKKKYLDYYKNTGFDEREELVDNWEQLVENEADLANELAEIYGDDTKGLHLALDTFQHLDFVEKEKALEKHEYLVEKKTEKNELHKELILEGVDKALEKAMEDGTISEKTAERYTALFSDPEKYKNPETNQPGDLATLEKWYKILTSPNPQPEHKNLAAYKAEREKFQEDIKRLGEINPDLEEEGDLAELQEEYDEEGWSKRKQLHSKLKDRMLKERLDMSKKREKEKAAGIDEEDKKEAKESPKEKLHVIDAATLLMSENNPRKALKMLMLYDEENPNDKQILFLIETAAKLLRENGSKEEEKDFEHKVEEELEEITKSESKKGELEEAQLINLNIIGAKQNEQRHDKQKSGVERAEDESMEHISGSLEKELAKQYYEGTDDTHILNEEGSGEEIQEVEFDDIEWTDEERHEAKEKMYHDQDRITTKEGLHSQFKDKSGRVISSEEAERRHTNDMADIADELAEEAFERAATKSKGEDGEMGEILEMQRSIAAKRAAKKFVDKKTTERIKYAA